PAAQAATEDTQALPSGRLAQGERLQESQEGRPSPRAALPHDCQPARQHVASAHDEPGEIQVSDRDRGPVCGGHAQEPPPGPSHLWYKAAWYGARAIVADRWEPSLMQPISDSTGCATRAGFSLKPQSA